MHVLLYGSYTRKRYREATSGEIERMLSAPRLDHRTCPPGSGSDVFIAPADGDEEFWPAWHARHPQPAAPAASIASEAENLGRDAGKAAASWVFDGNTPEDAYRAVLRGIQDGDPAVLDAYPAPGLSADGGYTEAGLARDLGLDDQDHLPPDAVTAYLDAADESFWHQTERLARQHLAAKAEDEDDAEAQAVNLRQDITDRASGLSRLLSKRCSTCILRPSDKMHLGPEQTTAFVRQALAEGTYVVCHQTLTYGDNPDFGPAICRGFYDAHASRSPALRLLRAFSRLTEIEPPQPQTGAP